MPSEEVDLNRRQLEIYARDLKRVLALERRVEARLDEAYDDTIQRLLSAVSFSSQETGEHLQRVRAYVAVLARALNMPEERATMLSAASTLHDIGKIAIPDAILCKPGPLDPEEREIVETHTTIGARILEGSPSPRLRLAGEIALTHHESWDGSGYPEGLVGSEIPRSGRIVKLADQYDALRSPRVYKLSLSHREAAAVILEGDGRTLPAHFDPELLELYQELHPEFDRIWCEVGGG